MTAQKEVIEHSSQAAHRVSDAAERWDATDLSAVVDCAATLESSAADLTLVLEILRKCPAESGSLLRSHIICLKKSAARLERLVDASSAFLRSAPGVVCENPGFYRAGGSMRPIELLADGQGVQG